MNFSNLLFRLVFITLLSTPIFTEKKIEEEVKEDSFEGFLRGQFEKILATESPNNREFRVIEFESFLEWRIRMGVFLSHKEILDIFQSVVGQTEYCSLMEFIQINYLIDENRTN